MKIIHVVGARPNFMKIAPIIRELNNYPEFHSILLHTGQHYDETMSDIFFKDLVIPPPDINLEVGSGSHAEQTAEIMMRFEPILIEQKPDLVLVVGDVNSTLACSLVAAKLHIPIAHVEAGVRSFDRGMPEEINRVVTDALADLLFTPSREADANLAHEGIAPEKIHFVGNVMVDTLLDAVELAAQRQTWLKWNFKPHEYAVLTLHRASNVDEINTISEIMSALSQVTTYLPILFPIHPRTSKRLVEANLDNKVQSIPGLILSEPLGYLDFLCLLSQAKMVLTDSGGIQAETTMLDVPCLTLRWNTEWGVTIAQGTNVLVGTDHDRIIEEAKRILEGHGKQGSRPELWDGNTAQRIATILTRF